MIPISPNKILVLYDKSTYNIVKKSYLSISDIKFFNELQYENSYKYFGTDDINFHITNNYNKFSFIKFKDFCSLPVYKMPFIENFHITHKKATLKEILINNNYKNSLNNI